MDLGTFIWWKSVLFCSRCKKNWFLPIYPLKEFRHWWNENKTWQPLGPLLKVKLLVVYSARLDVLLRCYLVGPTGKIPRSTLRGVQGIRRSPKMCQAIISCHLSNNLLNHSRFTQQHDAVWFMVCNIHNKPTLTHSQKRIYAKNQHGLSKNTGV